MKYALVFAAALVAFVAVAEAAPAPSDTYIKEDIKNAIRHIREKIGKQIDELQIKKREIMEKIREAHGDAKDQLKAKLDEITHELVAKFKELTQAVKDILRKKDTTQDDTYIKDAIKAKIAELRARISEATSALKEIMKQKAAETSEAAKKKLEEAREHLMEELGKLKNELLQKIREMFVPDDDMYVVDEALEQIIANLKEQLSEVMGVISDWHNFFTTEGRAKVAAAKDKAKELLAKIREAIANWKDSKKEEEEQTGETYMTTYDFGFGKALAALKAHLGKLKEKLEEKRAELKDVAAEKKEEVMKAINEIRAEIRATLADIKDCIKEMLGKKEKTESLETYGFKDVMAQLRGKFAILKELLNEKKEQMKQAAGEKKEQIKAEMAKIREQMKGIVSDIRKAFSEMFGKKEEESEMEVMVLGAGEETYILDTIKNLRQQINEKLAKLKELTEMAKTGTGIAKDMVREGIATLKEEIRKLRNDVLEQLKEIFNFNKKDQ